MLRQAFSQARDVQQELYLLAIAGVIPPLDFPFLSSVVHFSVLHAFSLFLSHREGGWLNADSVLCGSITSVWEEKNELN